MKKYFLVLMVLALLAAGKATAQIEDVVWQAPIGGLHTMVFSPDSKYIATGHKDQNTRIWDVSSGEIIKVLNNFGAIDALDYSTDGKYLAAGGRDGKVIIWDTETWEIIKELTEANSPENLVKTVRFSKDNSLFAVAGYYAGVLIYDTQNWQLIKQITDFPYMDNKTQTAKPRAHYVDFSYDNKYVAFSGDWTFLYNMEKDTIEKMLYGREPQFSPVNNGLLIKEVDYNHDSKPAIGLKYYESHESESPKSIGIGAGMFYYCISSEGNYIVTAHNGGQRLRIWDITKNPVALLYIYEPYSTLKSVAISNDNRYVATFNGSLLLYKTPDILTSANQKEVIENIDLTISPIPASKEINIGFEISNYGEIEISLSDAMGKEESILHSQNYQPGKYHINYRISRHPPGIYFVILRFNNSALSKKIILSK